MVSLSLLSLVSLGFLLGCPSLSYSSSAISNRIDVDRNNAYTTSSTPVGDVIEGDSVISGDSVVSVVPCVYDMRCSLYAYAYSSPSDSSPVYSLSFSLFAPLPSSVSYVQSTSVFTEGSQLIFQAVLEGYPYSCVSLPSNPYWHPLTSGNYSYGRVFGNVIEFSFVYPSLGDSPYSLFSSFSNVPYVADSVLGSVGEGLGLVGNLGAAFNDGFSRIFYDGNLTDVGSFAFVLMGLGVSVSLIGLCFSWITGKKVS